MKGQLKHLCAFAAGVALMFAAVGTATAQGSKYPERGINLFVGYSAGGSTDLIARAYAQEMSKKWGVPVTVVNKPGASGATALLDVKSAKPDGYTMLMHVNSGVTNPALQPSLPYKWDDLTYVLRLVTSPLVVVVKGDGPYKTLGNLISALKKDPGSVKLGLSGASGAGLFGTLQLAQAGGFDPSKVIRVVMPGGNQVVAAVAGGHVDYGVQYLSEVVDLTKGGKLRSLAIINASRAEALPDVPTMKDLGFPQIDWQPWAGIAGPQGLGKNVVDAWNRATKEILADPAFTQKVRNIGFALAYLEADAFKQFSAAYYQNALEVKKALP